jgi:hypothetical protein
MGDLACGQRAVGYDQVDEGLEARCRVGDQLALCCAGLPSRVVWCVWAECVSCFPDHLGLGEPHLYKTRVGLRVEEHPPKRCRAGTPVAPSARTRRGARRPPVGRARRRASAGPSSAAPAHRRSGRRGRGSPPARSRSRLPPPVSPQPPAPAPGAGRRGRCQAPAYPAALPLPATRAPPPALDSAPLRRRSSGRP